MNEDFFFWLLSGVYILLIGYFILHFLFTFIKDLIFKFKKSPFLSLLVSVFLVLFTVYLLFNFEKAGAEEVKKDGHYYPVFYMPEELNSVYGVLDKRGVGGGVEVAMFKEALRPLLSNALGENLYLSFPELYIGINVTRKQSFAGYAGLGIKFDLLKRFGVGVKGLFIYMTKDFSDFSIGAQTSIYNYYTFPSAIFLKNDLVSLYLSFKSPTFSFKKGDNPDNLDFANNLNLGFYYNPKISGSLSFTLEANVSTLLVSTHWGF